MRSNEINILLIEDDELDIISFERAIKKIDLPVKLVNAFNGNEALEILNGEEQIFNPDIIVLDLNMPKMNGIEFLNELRKDKKFDQVKIFVMTTSTEERDRESAMSLGINEYIIKPLNFNENTKKTSSMENFIQFQLLKMMRKKE